MSIITVKRDSAWTINWYRHWTESNSTSFALENRNKRLEITEFNWRKTLPVVDKHTCARQSGWTVHSLGRITTKCVNDNTPLVLSEVKISRTASTPMKKSLYKGIFYKHYGATVIRSMKPVFVALISILVLFPRQPPLCMGQHSAENASEAKKGNRTESKNKAFYP